MTDIPAQRTIVQYLTTNDETTRFDFAFYIPVDPVTQIPDIVVYEQLQGANPNPDADEQVYGEDYTVTFNGSGYEDGGYITFISHTPPLHSVITIARNMQTDLQVEFSNARSFSGVTLDEVFERIILLMQQLDTYAQQRNLSYIINTYLGEDDLDIQSNTQLPRLETGEIWQGTENGVIAVELEENPDVSTLRGELDSDAALSCGASIVGYYDINRQAGTTVNAYLNYTKLFGTASGTANALTLTVANTNDLAYFAGMEVKLIISSTNTGSATLNINDLGAKNIITATGTPVAVGELSSGKVAELIYDGTNFRLLNPSQRSDVPAGTILDYAGTSAPSGYLVCDGTTVLRADYPDLFAAIGTTWGAGDGSTNFVLPSLARRTTIGSGANTWTNSFATTVGTYGPTGAGIDDGANGAEMNTLTKTTMPNHNHTGSFLRYFTAGVAPKSVSVVNQNTTEGTITNDLVIASEGGDQPHNNMQPSAVVLKIIKT